MKFKSTKHFVNYLFEQAEPAREEGTKKRKLFVLVVISFGNAPSWLLNT